MLNASAQVMGRRAIYAPRPFFAHTIIEHVLRHCERQATLMAVISKHPDLSSPPRPGSLERKNRLKTTLRAYLWLSPLIVCLAVIVVYPLINGLLLSFTNADQTNIAEQIGAISYP